MLFCQTFVIEKYQNTIINMLKLKFVMFCIFISMKLFLFFVIVQLINLFQIPEHYSLNILIYSGKQTFTSMEILTDKLRS